MKATVSGFRTDHSNRSAAEASQASAAKPSKATSCTSLSDEQLLLCYQRRQERELFAELVRRYEREMYNYLRRFLGDAEMAEDVFQATFLQLHLKCDQFAEGRKVRPWLYTIATNQAIDAQRRNRRHRMVSLDGGPAATNADETGKLMDLLISGEHDPHVHVVALERGEMVRQAMDELPEAMRHVIQLVYYQGLKYREAADILDVPVGTVKSRLHAAIARLNEIWNKQHEDRQQQVKQGT